MDEMVFRGGNWTTGNWTSLHSDQIDWAHYCILDIENVVRRQLRPIIERNLLRMVQEAQEVHEVHEVQEAVWGLLVAARKAYPRVFATGLKSRRLRTVARAALDEAQKWMVGAMQTRSRGRRDEKFLNRKGVIYCKTKRRKRDQKGRANGPQKGDGLDEHWCTNSLGGLG